MTRHAVGHLDADCFYVSAERVRDSFLLHKPVGVLGNQRACDIAKTYEMKAAGVQTGEPIWDALKKCPQAIYLKRDFRWYEVLSRRMLGAVRKFSPRVEYYSIDEFFFEARPHRGLSLQATAAAIRDHIKRVVGVPVTVGIARSKTLAKLISDTAKPFGALAVLDPQAEIDLLAKRPVTDITGVAGRRAARLAPHRIVTCLDFARADRVLIRSLLTRVGEMLWYELNGESVQALHTTRPPHKMISRGGSIGKVTRDPNVVFAWVVRNLERLIEELHFHRVHTGHLTLYLSYREGMAGTGEGTLMSPTDRFDLLLEAAKHALRRAHVAGGSLQRMHLIASKLRWRGCVQAGLFDPPAEQTRAVARLKRRVNRRFGRFALRSAATLFLEEIYRDPANQFDICDVHGKMCF
jgi:nucleotidyltransferase/DNA polymerase involved in DNA repair